MDYLNIKPGSHQQIARSRISDRKKYARFIYCFFTVIVYYNKIAMDLMLDITTFWDNPIRKVKSVTRHFPEYVSRI